MTIPLIKKACKNLGLKFQNIDGDGVFIKVNFGKDDRYFLGNQLGLNDGIVEKVCLDKAFLHELLSSDVKMPTSISYIDSDPPELYKNYSKFNSHVEIVEDILQNNNFPLVLKPNSKSMGANVFICNDKKEVAKAVDIIFNKNSYDYDYIMLVQEKISIVKEYRVVVYKGKVQFVYHKDNTIENSEFIGNISPLHFENAKAVLVNDIEFISKLQKFITPIFEHLSLVYGGLDIAIDETGQFFLIEINSKPGFTYFIKDNGEDLVVKMFENILKDLSAPKILGSS